MAQTTLERSGTGTVVRRRGGPRVGYYLWMVAMYAMLLALTAFILLPVGWMLTAALKPDTAPVFTFPPEWFPTEFWNWGTFRDALLNPDDPFWRYSVNSLFLVAVNVFGAVLANSLIAYPFARLNFRGKNALFTILIATMLLPGPVLLIPQFLIFNSLGWFGTYLPLIVPTFAGNAFFIFLLRQYIRTIPKDLDEAARIDGAGYFGIWRRIILPLTAPALTVVAVFTALGVWNDFFGPLLYLDDPEEFTVGIALARMLHKVGTEWNEMMAANLVAMIPPLVLYFVAQKQLIGGIASVGIKG